MLLVVKYTWNSHDSQLDFAMILRLSMPWGLSQQFGASNDHQSGGPGDSKRAIAIPVVSDTLHLPDVHWMTRNVNVVRGVVSCVLRYCCCCCCRYVVVLYMCRTHGIVNSCWWCCINKCRAIRLCNRCTRLRRNVRTNAKKWRYVCMYEQMQSN
jgi:hypothetical protein